MSIDFIYGLLAVFALGFRGAIVVGVITGAISVLWNKFIRSIK